jgi:hypothetical protein
LGRNDTTGISGTITIDGGGRARAHWPSSPLDLIAVNPFRRICSGVADLINVIFIMNILMDATFIRPDRSRTVTQDG